MTNEARDKGASESDYLLREVERLALIGHYVFEIADDRWTSSAMLDQIFGIDAGYSRSAAGWLALVHAEEREQMAAYLRDHVIAAGKPFDKEYRIVRACDGAVRWVRGLGELELDSGLADGSRPLRLFGVIQDITESKRLADALRQQEIKFRALFETANDGIFLSDAKGFVDCNERGAAMYGLPRERIIGHSPAEFCPERQPDGRRSVDMAAEKIQLAMQGQPQTFDWQSLRADGAPFDVELTLNRIDMGNAAYVQAIVRDVTERKRTEQALAESESRFREIFNSVSDAIFIHDAATGRIIDVNRRMCDMYGLTRAQALACDVDTLSAGTPPYGEAEAMAKFRLLHSEGPQTFDWLARAHDGQLFWVEVSLRLAQIGNEQRVLAVVRDISARKHGEAQLHLAASVFTSSHEGIVITDAQARIIDVNQAFSRITGYDRLEVLGKAPSLLKSGQHGREFYEAMWETLRQTGGWNGEVWNRRKDGEVYAELLTISAVRGEGGEISHYVGVFADITLLKEHESKLERIAHFDALTGIPNRVLLADRMNQAVAQTRRANKLMAVCYLDLDAFKPVNDQLGHDAGDDLLVEMARRMKECVRGGDTVARIGGDEFVLLLLNLESADECEVALGRILDAIAQPMPLAGRTVSVSASLGVTLFPQDDADADTLLRHADQAMYRAKQSGKNRYQLFQVERSSA